MTQATPQQLEEAIPHILAAPKDAGVIETLCIRPDFGQRHFVDRVEMTQAGGIPGERWTKHPWMRLEDGSPDPRIQVCILQKRVLDLVWRDREETVYPGDTIIVDMDLSLQNLPTGTLLQAGSARLRVSDVFNTACVKWKTRYGQAALDWVVEPDHVPLRLRGILCEIIQDGVVSMKDTLIRIPPR